MLYFEICTPSLFSLLWCKFQNKTGTEPLTHGLTPPLYFEGDEDDEFAVGTDDAMRSVSGRRGKGTAGGTGRGPLLKYQHRMLITRSVGFSDTYFQFSILNFTTCLGWMAAVA